MKAKLAIVLGALLGTLGGYACNHGGDCRFDPDCGGGIGGFCDVNRDCADGFCCRSDNCGGGMCTFECDRDSDCPDDMACEHGNTICEWD